MGTRLGGAWLMGTRLGGAWLMGTRLGGAWFMWNYFSFCIYHSPTRIVGTLYELRMTESLPFLTNQTCIEWGLA